MPVHQIGPNSLEITSSPPPSLSPVRSDTIEQFSLDDASDSEGDDALGHAAFQQALACVCFLPSVLAQR